MPHHILDQPESYRWALDTTEQPTVSLCPRCEETWTRDRNALVGLMTYLKRAGSAAHSHRHSDRERTRTDGDRPLLLHQLHTSFRDEKWVDRYGEHAAESFSAASIATYIDRLAKEAKAISPLPMYTNAWLSPAAGGRPGRDYPAGGPVPEVLPLFRLHVQGLDLVAPDIYRHGYRDFHRLCEIYTADANPLYIAEHSSSPTGRSERNVFYAIGAHGAIGFDPWAIDAVCPDRHEKPFVDPIGKEWGPHAYQLRDSYVSISRAITPIVEAQGTNRLFTFVQEAEETGTAWHADGVDILISFCAPGGAGRGMLIQCGEWNSSRLVWASLFAFVPPTRMVKMRASIQPTGATLRGKSGRRSIQFRAAERGFSNRAWRVSDWNNEAWTPLFVLVTAGGAGPYRSWYFGGERGETSRISRA